MSRAAMPTTERSSDVVRPVSRPQDASERQAERAAGVVASGGHVRGWSFASVSTSGPERIDRQDAGAGGQEEKEKASPDAKEYREAAETTGKALRKTDAGKALERRILSSPPVQKLKRAATSPAGLAVGGVAIAGGLTGLALAGKPLPFQLPSVPLDLIEPGLSAQAELRGPVNAPTFVGLTITYAPKARPSARPSPTPQPSVPVRSAAEEARLTQEAIDHVVRQQAGRFSRVVPIMQLEVPTDTEGADPERDTDAPVQRRAAATAAPDSHAPATADPAAGPAAAAGPAGSGRPLTPGVRRAMEARFGHDFSAVRVHADQRAATAAASVHAQAFTVGQDIVVGGGRDIEASPHLLAHELTHVVQQGQHPGSMLTPLQRRDGDGPASLAQPTPADHEMFVDAAIRHLRGAADHFRTVARTASVTTAPEGTAPEGAAPEATAPASPSAPAPAPVAAGRVPSGLDPERLRTVLRGLLDTYEGARRIVDQRLSGDVARGQRLQEAYVGAVDAARSAAVATGRLNLVLIAAPKDRSDEFMTNATTYASLYFGAGQPGDTVQQVADIGSPAELFDTIEAAAPDQMLRRIDIFAHGTIEPTHQIRFGASWYSIAQLEAEAASRAATGPTLQSQSRFDGTTVIEIHACRLGAAESQAPDGGATTQGTDALNTIGRGVGGERGQSVIAYEQRWVPRRFEVPGVRSTADVGSSGPRSRAFDDMAVGVWDAAMAGGVEANSQLTDAERAPGAVVSRERKIAIMRRLYDAAGGAWLIGHQYSGAHPQSRDPQRDVRRARDTFSNEADWDRRILRVTVPRHQGVNP